VIPCYEQTQHGRVCGNQAGLSQDLSINHACHDRQAFDAVASNNAWNHDSLEKKLSIVRLFGSVFGLSFLADFFLAVILVVGVENREPD